MKFFCLSPYSVPENPCLFPILRKHWEGHEFVERIEDCQVCLLDLHTRISLYKQSDVDWLINSDVPCVVWDEFDRGNLSKEIWPHPLTRQQNQIFGHLQWDIVRSIHFCRLLDKTKRTTFFNSHYEYSEVLPYEKPISYEEPLLTPEQLFNREFDIVFIANYSPSREAIAGAFLTDGRFKVKVSIGQTKIEFQDFVREHKKAKMFVACGAGGMSCERKQCLFSVAALIQDRTEQLKLHYHTDLENCIYIDTPPSKKDLDNIYEVVNNKEKLYYIYRQGYEFMKAYYSEEYIANNILQSILKSL